MHAGVYRFVGLSFRFWKLILFHFQSVKFHGLPVVPRDGDFAGLAALIVLLFRKFRNLILLTLGIFTKLKRISI